LACVGRRSRSKGLDKFIYLWRYDQSYSCVKLPIVVSV
jgi:hypothetical protein